MGTDEVAVYRGNPYRVKVSEVSRALRGRRIGSRNREPITEGPRLDPVLVREPITENAGKPLRGKGFVPGTDRFPGRCGGRRTV